MNYNKIILDYINQEYKVHAGNNIIVIEGHNNCTIVLSEIIDETSEIYDYNTKEICESWYNSKKNELIKKISDYLDKYKVICTPTSWLSINKKTNQELDVDEIVKHFDGDYSNAFVRNIHGDWFMSNIINESAIKMNLKHNI